MKKLILASILGLSVVSTSNAFAYSYKCSVAANEDYAVEINFKTNRAAFFDNNEWSILNDLKGLSTFVGKDVYGDKLMIHFDATEGLVQHHWIKYFAKGRMVTSEMDCSFDKNLNSGI